MPAYVKFRIPEWLDWLFTWPLMLWRKFKSGRPFRWIYLGEGERTKVDPDVYYRLGHYNWYLSGNGKNFYAYRNYKIASGKTKMLNLQREIMQPPRHLLIDHHNRDSLDNLMSNLRLATHSENNYNRPKIRSKTSSKYIGVYFEKATGRWTVKIRVNGNRLWLGRFTDELDAARAYDDAARKYHEEFAKLNFPE